MCSRQSKDSTDTKAPYDWIALIFPFTISPTLNLARTSSLLTFLVSSNKTLRDAITFILMLSILIIKNSKGLFIKSFGFLIGASASCDDGTHA